MAVVTAASRGLGQACARAFALEGAHVALCARSDQLLRTADEIRAETGAQVLAIRADLSQPADIERFIRATQERFGRIDILLINAGGPPPGDFLSLSISDWEGAVKLTLMSAVRLCYAVVPGMVARRSGCIIASQSVSAKQPLDQLVLSNALRMAVVGLMKSLANELGPYGIRVNTINPGPVLTDRTQQLLSALSRASGLTLEQQMERELAAIPLRRMATPEEYASAVVWLASPAAGYIHGHALSFDGGLTRSPL